MTCDIELHCVAHVDISEIIVYIGDLNKQQAT